MMTFLPQIVQSVFEYEPVVYALSAMLSSSVLTISSSDSGEELKNWDFSHIFSPVILCHHKKKHAHKHIYALIRI